MQGSTSPAKKGSPSCSHLQCSWTSRTARRAPALAGSRPNACNSIKLQVVEVHWGKRVPCLSGGSDCHQFAAAVAVNLGMPPSHWPSWRWRASKRAPQPSLAARARSAATCSAGASVRSLITCQRIAGSESNSHSMTSIRFYILRREQPRRKCKFTPSPSPVNKFEKYLQTWPKQLTSEQMYDRIDRCWGRGELHLAWDSQSSSALCLSTSPDPTFGRTCSTLLKFATASTS